MLQLFRNAKEFSASFEDEMKYSMIKKEQSQLLGSYSQHVSQVAESGSGTLSPFIVHALRDTLPKYFEHHDDDTPNFGLFKLICRIINSNDLGFQNASDLVLRL